MAASLLPKALLLHGPSWAFVAGAARGRVSRARSTRIGPCSGWFVAALAVGLLLCWARPAADLHLASPLSSGEAIPASVINDSSPARVLGEASTQEIGRAKWCLCLDPGCKGRPEPAEMSCGSAAFIHFSSVGLKADVGIAPVQSELHIYRTPPLPGASSAANTHVLVETDRALLVRVPGVTSAWVLRWRSVTRQSYTAPQGDEVT